MNRVRIFISSPGDVADERKRALAVVERLQAEFSDTLALEPLLWEQEPLLATADFQSQIRSPADFDIFATIIGSRLGSPLGSQFTRRDGSPYSSGTEFEFEVAVASYHASGRPEPLVYRKSLLGELPVTAQVDKVSAFFDKWFRGAGDPPVIGEYHSFTESGEFEDLFTRHLRELLHRFLPRPNNLPAPISSFVGRTDLIREITGLLRQGDTRVVALVGPGGAGKSRLALRSARGLQADFADGTFLINLASRQEADVVPREIAAVLGIEPDPGCSPMDSVVEALHDREILLLLDNLEQFESAVVDIDTLVSGCPGLKVLVTSRETPALGKARIIRVPPLALPGPDTTDFAAIRDSECVQLFVDRARTAREDFELSKENAGEVLQICHQLEGLPLAIELAASRMRSMNTTKLLQRILKGGLLRGIDVNISAAGIDRDGCSRIAVDISDFRELVATHLTVDFGDGSDPLQLDLGEYTPGADDSLTLTLEHDYSGISASGVTVAVEVRAAGARGSDEKMLSA
ncbi:MAG: NB-ARC domain-containing protein [Halieaceae bacterium]|jgi:hypothetical protein|nr:NB-ARC domain-containing protein [Halieaceae bacterium]